MQFSKDKLCNFFCLLRANLLAMVYMREHFYIEFYKSHFLSANYEKLL